MLSARLLPMASGEGFVPPGPESFDLPPIVAEITKPMVMVGISVVIIFGLTWLMSRRAAVVPGRLQFAGEFVYGSIRNSMGRDIIGSEHYMKFVPYLFSLFMFVLVNNYFGIIPIIQLPSFSHVGYTYGLALLSWLLYIGVGIWRHGPLGYLKSVAVPGGVSGPVLVLIVPLEILSNIIVRPVTLALRLFANMFAGHLLLILFATGSAYLLFEAPSALNIVGGVGAVIMYFLVSILELLVMFLQAYVFTLLTAIYIQGSLADEH